MLPDDLDQNSIDYPVRLQLESRVPNKPGPVVLSFIFFCLSENGEVDVSMTLGYVEKTLANLIRFVSC